MLSPAISSFYSRSSGCTNIQSQPHPKYKFHKDFELHIKHDLQVKYEFLIKYEFFIKYEDIQQLDRPTRQPWGSSGSSSLLQCGW